MTNSNRHLLYALGMMALVLLIGGAAIVWPRYREAASLTAERHDLIERMDNISLHTEALAELTEDVSRVRQVVEQDLKDIPPSPGMHELMNRLSLTIDDETVLEQTFSAGQVSPAVHDDDDFSLMAMPVTVDMVGRFDAVFATIRAAEQMPRLVRVTSVRLSLPREYRDRESGPDEPLVQAEIGLEAVFEPPDTQEGSS